METKVLRSAIETFPIVICIPTHDSTLLSNKARIFVCSNRLFVVNMAGVEQGSVSNEEFTEEVARYECVYHRNSKEFKDRNKKANCWEKIGEKFNLSAAEAEVKFRNIRTAYGRYLKQLKTLPSGSGRDAVPREFQNLEWLNPHISHRPSSTNLRSKSPAGTAESSSETRSSLTKVWNGPSSCLFMNIFRTQNRCFRRF